jgi:hypothetical protein
MSTQREINNQENHRDQETRGAIIEKHTIPKDKLVLKKIVIPLGMIRKQQAHQLDQISFTERNLMVID